eukprot:scaffold11977_cov107-Cylindrotheca_fusiformis.AAC.2
MNYYPDGYEPTSKDILCGRGKGNLRHEGNQYFMHVIRANLQRYTDAPKRIDKSLVVSLIVSSLKDEGYNFVRQETKTRRWFQLSEPQVHEKTGHAIRDILKKGGNGGQQTPPSQSKQAMSSGQADEPDVVASQILSTALKVSKLVEKSKIDFAALSAGQGMPPRNSRDFKRSSIVRLFDELSPEEPNIPPAVISLNDQPLPIDSRTSDSLRSSDMMNVINVLAKQEPIAEVQEPEEFIHPNSKRMGSSIRSSRSFRRSELLQFLDFTDEELMEVSDDKPAPANIQPIPVDTSVPATVGVRTSDTLNAWFKDQEEIFSNLQNVFGTLPDEDESSNDEGTNRQEREERNSRASEVLGELLKRQEGLFEELQQIEMEYDVGTN